MIVDLIHMIVDLTHMIVDLTHMIVDLTHMIVDLFHMFVDLTHMIVDLTHMIVDLIHMIVDLTAKGWIPKSGKIDRLCETLKKLNLTEIDTVVIDSMSNTAFLGTDSSLGRYVFGSEISYNKAPPACLG